MSGVTDVTFITGYNPTHLAGLDDWLNSAQEIYAREGQYVATHDLHTILRQIYPELTTRRVLLVGHSQGTFYTNTIYQYFLAHGVPKEDVSVYNIATPASFVAGGGNYLTSSNDQLVKRVRELAAQFHAPLPLLPNIILPITEEEASQPYGGHSLGDDYLAHAPDRVIADMDRALSKLQTTEASNTGDCFTPPDDTLADAGVGYMFNVGDPISSLTYDQAKNSFVTLSYLGRGTGELANRLAARMTFFISETAHALAARVDALFSKTAENQSAAAALAAPQPQSSTPVPLATSPSPPPRSPAAPTYNGPPAVSSDDPHPSLSPAVIPIDTSDIPPMPLIPPPPPIPGGYTPGFGGGGPPPPEPRPAELPAAESTSMPPVIPLSILSPSDGNSFATSTVLFLGTTTPNALIVVSYGGQSASTTSDGSGEWALALRLPEGTTIISCAAFDSATGASTTQSLSVSVSLPPPPPAVASDAGWFCAPDTDIGVDVSTTVYQPQSGDCTYLSSFLPDGVLRTLALYRGTVGSGELLYEHATTKTSYDISGDTLPAGVADGEPFFISMWKTATTTDDADFGSYFTTGETTTGSAIPPSQDYMVLPFTYGDPGPPLIFFN